MIIMEVDNLTKRFGGLIAIQNVTFDVKQGEIVGLIGPNGAGKTTLFNVISGFLRPNSGVVKFKGENITGLKPHEVSKKGISRTFQIVKPFLKMTVLENVAIGALRGRLFGVSLKEAKHRAIEILRDIGLLDKKDYYAGSLTIADLRRLEIARALAAEPELMLLDEVAAGLNPAEINDIVQLLRKINGRGVTLLIIEHVMRAIMSLSNRIIVLHHGRKIAEGAPEEVATDKEVIDAYLGERYVFA